jgi:hypothetical protein
MAKFYHKSSTKEASTIQRKDGEGAYSPGVNDLGLEVFDLPFFSFNLTLYTRFQ